MANIRQLTEDNNQVFYPQTHEKAVIDGNGNTLDVKIAGKQDNIADLSTIRSGAALGSTSVQPVDIEGMVKAEPIGSIIPPVDPSEFATAEEVSQLQQEVTADVSQLEAEMVNFLNTSTMLTTAEEGFFVVDSNYNIGLSLTAVGLISKNVYPCEIVD